MTLLRQPPNPSIPTVATDLEGTLTSGITWKGLYNYLLTHGHTNQARWFYLTHMPKYFTFKLFGGDYSQFKNDWMRDLLRLFKGYTTAQFAAMCAWVVENELWPNRRKAVIAELEAHLQAGRRVLIVTGMFEPLIQELNRKLSGSEGVGTSLVWNGDHFTGEMGDDFNVGERKRERLYPFANDGKIYAAYGDTLPDVSMLEMSEHPVAVYPDLELRTTAQQRGWRILEA